MYISLLYRAPDPNTKHVLLMATVFVSAIRMEDTMIYINIMISMTS